MSVDRLVLDQRAPLSLSKAHKRLAAFLDRQLASQPTLPTAADAISAVDDETSGATLRAVDRVKVADHVIYQLNSIAAAILQERGREKAARHAGGTAIGREDGSRQRYADDNLVVGVESSIGDSTGTSEGKRRKKHKQRRRSPLVEE